MTAPETAGRQLPRDLPPKAPASPRVKQWNRRILAWGMAPPFLAGLVAGVAAVAAPELAGTLTTGGAVLMIVVTVPIAIQAVRVRRRNQRAYEAAASEARAADKVVRVVETPNGDYTYRVVEPPAVTPLAPSELGRGAAS